MQTSMNHATPSIGRPRAAAQRRVRTLTVALLLAVGLAAAGCSGSPDGDDSTGAGVRGVKLQLLVVGDPPLAEAVGQLEGQWRAELGGQFEVSEMTVAQLEEADALACDVVICPSGQLGRLAGRKQIAPISRAMLVPYEKPWSDMFDLCRFHEAAWGTEIYAVPLGSPVLYCYYRTDLLEKVGRKPPTTWDEYQELVAMLADRSLLGEATPAEAPWHGAIEPLGPGWGGQTLLARAAAYAKHPDRYSTLLDIETMEPLVDGPPFVRALEELVAAVKTAPPEVLQYDPDAVRQAFWEGRCGLALSWPTAAAKLDAAAAKPGAIACGLVPLPGSRDVYDGGEKAWTKRPADADLRIPLLATTGRLGAVATTSDHPEAALRVLFWLAAKQGVEGRKPATTATTLFRGSDLAEPKVWVEPPVAPAAAAQYAESLQQTLSGRQWLFSPRIPGRAEYLAALDKAVAVAVRGEKSSQEALSAAAQQWRELTRRLGVQKQREAYLQSLELE